MRQMLSLSSLVALIVSGLSACASGDTRSVSLPLAESGPTFLFFYTDN